jgi:para-nitrobenzyl esterase
MSEYDGNDVEAGFPSTGLRRRDVLIFGASAAILSLMAPRIALSKTRLLPAFIEIANGKLRGETTGGIISVKGIPYGAPTGGANRFLPPQPVAKWAGVRDATKLGNQCPQQVVWEDLDAYVDPSKQSEDCLYLYVWAPERPKKPGKLPVMVWLHGGGYTLGSAGSPIYDGSNLARQGDVILVSVNHRLNIFGFSFLETTDERFAAAGNAGLLDIVEALRWVRNNIAAFGVQVQRRMLEAWAAFAWTGNPSTSTLQWPAYDLTSRATMVFDGESKVENDPRPSLTRAAASIF